MYIMNPKTWFESSKQYQKNILQARGINVWDTVEDRMLAENIESEILNRYYGREVEEIVFRIPQLKNVCVVQSIYYKTADAMKELGIDNKVFSKIDYKKEYLSYGGDNSSVIIFVKNNNQVIPVFVNMDFVDIKSKLFQKQKFGCYYLKDDVVNIKISRGKGKAVVSIY